MTTHVCPHCGGALSGMVRLSITVPADLNEWVRARAAKENTTISAVVAEAIRLYRQTEQRGERVAFRATTRPVNAIAGPAAAMPRGVS